MDKAWLTYEVLLNGNISADDVKTRLNLPTQIQPTWTPAGTYGDCDIVWESSNINVIALDGRVTRPTKEQGDQIVTLTATISKNEEFDKKTFQFTVTIVEEFSLAIKYDDFSVGANRLQFNGIYEIVSTTDRDGNSIQDLKLQNGSAASGGSIFTKNKIRLGHDLSFGTTFSFRNPHPNYITKRRLYIYPPDGEQRSIWRKPK